MTGIPSRRAARRIDENAPPHASSTIATRSRTAGNGANAAGGSTAIPVMKRTASTLTSGATSSRSAATGSENKADAGKLGTKRRAALGEINPTAGGKGKEVAGKGTRSGVDRRPLASTQTAQSQPTLRRTTRTTAVAADAKVEEKTTTVKRKAASTSTRTRPAFSRANSAASHASTSTAASGATSRTTRSSRTVKPTASLSEAQPAAKRARTASPPEDVLDAQYDDDNRVIDQVRAVVRPAKDEGWTDLDAEDELDPSMVHEYVVDAFNYMMETEKQTMPVANYMDHQEELQWKMRMILNDWIIEVHAKFRLLPETLFVATNLIDRFLSERTVSLVKFQLVGLTALFVAAKYEEVIAPSVTHFLHMTDGGYDVSEILRAELYLLSTLEWDFSYPNPLHFLRRVSKADGYDVHARTVAKYFIEVSCVEHRLLPYPPSMLAAAAMFMARLCLDRGPWHANMVHYSGYAQHELLPCAQVMLDFIVSDEFDMSTAFYKKYASKKHLKASSFVREWGVQRWPDSAKGRSPHQGSELAAEFGDGPVQAPPPATP